MWFGIMQGRLSPSQENLLQFFPRDWRAEFEKASLLGFDTLEWIFDDPLDTNPLTQVSGRSNIQALSKLHGVSVQSICADIFMKHHLIIKDSPAVTVLVELLRYAEEAGIKLVNIPLLEGNLPATDEQFAAVVDNLRIAVANSSGAIDVALEVDLPAQRIISLIRAVGSKRVGVCYDTGNAMTYGYDAGSDIRLLGNNLKQIHFKDRIRWTRQSVYLGEGSVNFLDVCSALREVNFDGLCVLQTWRGQDYLSDAKRQLEYIRNSFIQH